jgi:hypothetical protein
MVAPWSSLVAEAGTAGTCPAGTPLHVIRFQVADDATERDDAVGPPEPAARDRLTPALVHPANAMTTSSDAAILRPLSRVTRSISSPSDGPTDRATSPGPLAWAAV